MNIKETIEALLRSVGRAEAGAMHGSHTAASDRDLLRALADAMEKAHEGLHTPRGILWGRHDDAHGRPVLILPDDSDIE